jgi:thioredoxin
MAIVVCPNCGAKNRVDESRADSHTRAVCARCKQELPPAHSSTEPVTVTDATFESVLADAGDRPVLIDFWAAWCPPCRALAPTIEQLAAEADGRYIIGKLNTDQNPRTAARFRINSIPAMLVFENGELVDQIVGLQPKEAIRQVLAAHI